MTGVSVAQSIYKIWSWRAAPLAMLFVYAVVEQIKRWQEVVSCDHIPPTSTLCPKRTDHLFLRCKAQLYNAAYAAPDSEPRRLKLNLSVANSHAMSHAA